MKNAKELTENEIRALERGQVELVSNSNKLDSRGEFEHRDIAVAIELCRMEDNTDLVVHFKNGKIDFVLDKDNVKLLKAEMLRLLIGGKK